jgi:hypothetical protein
MEGLLGGFLHILSYWDNVFPQKRTANRARRLAISLLLAMGRKTISRANAITGRDQLDWSADYRLFSRCEWSHHDLFQPLLEIASNLISESVIAVGYDDTLVKKTGKKIKGTSWQRDPLSPPFNCNFAWGMRYLQASLLLPLYNNRAAPSPCRAIPIQFIQLPKFKKPKRSASEEEVKTYNELKKRYNASSAFVENTKKLRQNLDYLGLTKKQLLIVVDGSYCNRTCFRAEIPNTDLIGRARKNARLYFKSLDGNRKFYNPVGFTPEEIRMDEERPYAKGDFHYGGEFRTIRFKDVKEVYWKQATRKRPLRRIILAPTPYRRTKNGSLCYREAAYLLTTDLTSPAHLLIQKYLDRWQIEVNFQEEKGLMGLGDQQLWSDKSIPKAPAFIASIYGAMLLSSVLLTKDRRDHKLYGELPKWRNKSTKRPSCFDLLALVRKEILTRLLSEALDSNEDLFAVTRKVIEKSAA